MPDSPMIIPLHDCEDLSLCGGKAINLGRMIRAGLPVPEGFVISTNAYHHWQPDVAEVPESLAEEIAAAYRQLGSPAVAVRSSATAEDLAEASMAGQYETFLDVRGEDDLLTAVQHCWQSMGAERLQAYLREHGIDAASVAMAIVVQRLVPADMAGVLFTANPRTGARDEMLIEAAWGLGEAVVSGSVQPDVIVLDRTSGVQKLYRVADKAVWIEAGSGNEWKPVEHDRRKMRCLNDQNLRDLWDLGRRAVEYFDGEQDLEWAICDDRAVLLQSRAITTLDDADEYRRCLELTRESLRKLKAAGRGDWVRHNIAETLPRPTPLTWSVIRRFMSGSGGFGKLYREVGFEPAERVCQDGFLELLGGRIYMDLSLAPEMYFDRFPFRYDADLLRCRPDAAQQPPSLPVGSWTKQAQMAKKLGAIEKRLLNLANDCDHRLDEDVIPKFTAWVRQEKHRDLSALSADQWCELWVTRERHVFDELAAEILLPSMITAMAIERLRTFLHEHFWDERPDDLLNLLAVGGRADGTVTGNESLRAVGLGQGLLEGWLDEYGHRGPEEFDLAAPRWREQPEEVHRMAAWLADAASPMATHRERLVTADRIANRLQAKLPLRCCHDFDQRLSLVRRFLPWREDGKAVLMLGYDLLRDLALEAGRRLAIGEDVFLLTLDEVRESLDQPTATETDENPKRERGTPGTSPKRERGTQATISLPLSYRETIQDRRRRRAAERRVSLPLYLGSEEIKHLGEPPETDVGRSFRGVAISTGSAAGPVRIVHAPRDARDLGRGYVLVCPSTDPSWTPLFVGAAGLVLECGGMLSHGAVVAREMGIPAVVLPTATRLFDDGETITVDGQHGVVLREGADTQALESAIDDPRDVRIAPDRIPPVRGPGERRAATLRSVFFLIWGVYLAAVFLLPRPWCYDPSMKLLDAVLWPLVSALGKPAAVAVIAAGLAFLTMIGQRLLTDNRRLLAAKNRAGRLRREAARLPVGSPRRSALVRAARGVQPRLLGASFVPLAVLLGPMVMSFVWLPERVDPASWNPPPGAVAYVTATVDGEYSGPISLELDSALTLERQTEVSQSLPPIRVTLTNLLAKWQSQTNTPHPPASKVPPAMVADLEEYLDGRIPLQELTWTIHTPPEPGRYSIALSTRSDSAIQTSLVLGDRFPPETKEDLGDGRGPLQVVRSDREDSPIEQITVIYQFPRTLGDREFFAPLEHVPLGVLADRGWTRWDAGWLLTYIAIYLLILLPVRWLLRIP